MDPKLKELLRLVAEAMEGDAELDYAIGGALAMRAHGYKRHTDDVDLFAQEKDRAAVLRALREVGLNVTPIFSPHHYIATVPGETDPDSRIDVMFPSAEPDLSAVEFPDEARLADIKVMVWPMPLIVIAKFYSDRPQDRLDLAALLDRGLFDPKHVASMIEVLDGKDGVIEFMAVIKQLTEPQPHRPKPARKRKP